MFHVKHKSFDVAVIGAGHAGVEAALLHLGWGLKFVLLLSLQMTLELCLAILPWEVLAKAFN